MTSRVTTATATRQGSESNNADAAATFAAGARGGITGAAVIDIIGHPPTAPTVAALLAETAARVAAQRGTLAGLLSAALLISDPGTGMLPEPNAVAVAAAMTPGTHTVLSWIGDSHGYGWNGQRLHRYTTPHTLGEQLRANGAPWPIAAQHDNWVNAALADATPATVFTVTADDPLIILASDGLDALTTDALTDLIRQHETNPAALATALVNAVPTGPDGYRDDTTVAILRHPH
jgi:serine/threonine protein phosphatase PrpC